MNDQHLILQGYEIRMPHFPKNLLSVFEQLSPSPVKFAWHVNIGQRIPAGAIIGEWNVELYEGSLWNRRIRNAKISMPITGVITYTAKDTEDNGCFFAFRPLLSLSNTYEQRKRDGLPDRSAYLKEMQILADPHRRSYMHALETVFLILQKSQANKDPDSIINGAMGQVFAEIVDMEV